MTTQDSVNTPPAVSDAELITASRDGDASAFGELYTRHVAAAERLARMLTRDGAAAEDLVADAFAKVLATLRVGGGPDVAFRPYLLTTVRNARYDRIRGDRLLLFADDMSPHDVGVPFEDSALDGLERSLAARAFARLPERWQLVLWHTEVEGESPAQVAPLLGLTANGVSALAYRARERLRQAYLQEHIERTDSPDCHWAAQHLGAHVRDGLSDRERRRVDDHLHECDTCRTLFVELGEVNSGLRGVLAPIVLGGLAAGYLSANGAGVGAIGLGWVLAPWHWAQASFGTAASAVGVAAAAAVATVVVVAGITLAANTPPSRTGSHRPPAVAQALAPSAVPSTAPTVAAPGPTPTPGPAAVPSAGAAVTPGVVTPPVTGGPPSIPPPVTANADLSATLTGRLIRHRTNVLRLTVSNAGPSSSGAVRLVITLPRGTTATSRTLGGWSCEGKRTLVCGHAALATGGHAYGTVTVKVDKHAPLGGQATASVGSNVSDSRLSNNVASTSGVQCKEKGRCKDQP